MPRVAAMAENDETAYTLRFTTDKESSHEDVTRVIGLVNDAAGVGAS